MMISLSIWGSSPDYGRKCCYGVINYLTDSDVINDDVTNYVTFDVINDDVTNYVTNYVINC